MTKAVRDAMERLRAEKATQLRPCFSPDLIERELQRLYDMGRVAGMREAVSRVKYCLTQGQQKSLRSDANALARKVRKG